VDAPARAHDGAVGQDDLEAEHVVAGHAVLQAARAAGIGGDVAADRRLLERGRVGRVIPAHGAGRVAHVAGDGPRLDHRHAVAGVDLDDPVHVRQREHDAAMHRHAAAHVPDARPARDHGDVVGVGKGHEVGHVLCRFGEDDHVGQRRGIPFVAGVGGKGVGVGGHLVRAEQVHEGVDQGRFVHARA